MIDLRFAFRQLLKNPGFTAVAVLTLAICLGGSLAIFAVVDAVPVRPLPFPDADWLVVIHNTSRCTFLLWPPSRSSWLGDVARILAAGNSCDSDLSEGGAAL